MGNQRKKLNCSEYRIPIVAILDPAEDKIASIIPTSIKDMVNIYKLAL